MYRVRSRELSLLKVTGFRGSDLPVTSQNNDTPSQARSFTQGKAANHYKILGLASDSNPKDIKAAYYRLSKVYHPDVNKSPAAIKQFQLISEAYEILGNEVTRRQYDLEMGILRGERPMRHGQKRYQPKGTPPTGMSSFYNFDRWYKEHYSETFERTQDDRAKAREHAMEAERMRAYDTDPRDFKMDDLTKATYIMAAVATIAFILKRLLK